MYTKYSRVLCILCLLIYGNLHLKRNINVSEKHAATIFEIKMAGSIKQKKRKRSWKIGVVTV